MPKHLTDEQVIEGRALRATGLSWYAIASHFGMTNYHARKAIEPGFRKGEAEVAQRKAYVRPSRAKPKEPTLRSIGAVRVHGEVSNAELAVLRQRIPPDTRSLTAMLMGDPMPGRAGGA